MMVSRSMNEFNEMAELVPANEEIPLLLVPSALPGATSLSSEMTTEDEATEREDETILSSKSICKNRDHACSRYASKRLLGRYIPEIDEKHVRSKTRKTEASKRSKMLRNQFITAAVICLANITILICFWVFFPPDSKGIGTIRMGDCSEITSINSAAHVIMNILSSIYLGAGSYCMQVLVAPSRLEMDNAHARGVSLDIGVQSVRNLRWISRRRIFQWVGIGLLSICLHLFWNSLLFTSTSVVSYASATVTSDFKEVGRDWVLDPLPWALSGRDWSPVHDLYYQMDNFTRIDKRTCIDTYIDALTTKRPLVVVAENVTAAQHNRTLLSGWLSGWDVWSRAPWWICGAYNQPTYNLLCTKEWADKFVDDWAVIAWDHPETVEIGTPFWVKVDYCLVGSESDIGDRCGLNYGTQIFTVVGVCTLLQCCFLSIVWASSSTKYGRLRKEKTMVLMGDAIAEYLQIPGDITRSRAFCLSSQIWRPRDRISWFGTVSWKVWTISLILLALGIATPLALLISSVVTWKRRGLDMSLPAIFKLGFGLNPGFLGMNSETSNYNLIQCVFLANIIQLLVSFLYLFYNNIVTRQLVADQWVRFLRPSGKKSLRVSTPLGMQRSSYILSLPLTYSSILVISMILLHWLVSQSVFVVQTLGLDTSGNRIDFPHFNGSNVGYALLPIALSTLWGGVMILGLLANSLLRSHRDVSPDFPTWGSSSAHIELLCQRPDADFDAHLFPVSMGVVSEDLPGGIKERPRLAFSTDIDLCPPEAGMAYLLPVAQKTRLGVVGKMKQTSHRVWKFLRKVPERF